MRYFFLLLYRLITSMAVLIVCSTNSTIATKSIGFTPLSEHEASRRLANPLTVSALYTGELFTARFVQGGAWKILLRKPQKEGRRAGPLVKYTCRNEYYSLIMYVYTQTIAF
jgi:hypothetical protein